MDQWSKGVEESHECAFAMSCVGIILLGIVVMRREATRKTEQRTLCACKKWFTLSLAVAEERF
jgi:hypothetical protein